MEEQKEQRPLKRRTLVSNRVWRVSKDIDLEELVNNNVKMEEEWDAAMLAQEKSRKRLRQGTDWS